MDWASSNARSLRLRGELKLEPVPYQAVAKLDAHEASDAMVEAGSCTC
jgi:hypothetical protein